MIYEAKARGFDPKAEASNAAAPELTAESRAARAEQRRIDDENTAAALLKAHNTAAIKAQALWDVAAIDANSPYLGIKGVSAHGVRFEVAGDDVTVLVPLRDNANRLWNVQRIKPDGTKLFMKSARVSGLYHLMGTVDAQGCLIGAVEPNGWLLVAEGYATAAGLTGWQAGESRAAAKACFDAWIAYRGGWGNSEAMAMLAQVRGWFAANGEARFTSWHRATDDHKPNTSNRAGFRRMLKGGKDYEPPQGVEERYAAEPSSVLDYEIYFYVMPEVFKNEICKGFDDKAVAKLLHEHGIIERDSDGFRPSVRLPLMGKTRCYRFTPKLFETD